MTIITPSQDTKILKIKKHFELVAKTKSLATFKWKLDSETGKVLLEVETTENILTMEGGLFQIGRRGKVEALIVFALSRKDEYKKFYNDFLN